MDKHASQPVLKTLTLTRTEFVNCVILNVPQAVLDPRHGTALPANITVWKYRVSASHSVPKDTYRTSPTSVSSLQVRFSVLICHVFYGGLLVDGLPVVVALTDCAGVINGTKIIDRCGVCGGDNTSCNLKAVYVRWGRTTCPPKAKLLYYGVAARYVLTLLLLNVVVELMNLYLLCLAVLTTTQAAGTIVCVYPTHPVRAGSTLITGPVERTCTVLNLRLADLE